MCQVLQGLMKSNHRNSVAPPSNSEDLQVVIFSVLLFLQSIPGDNFLWQWRKGYGGG